MTANEIGGARPHHRPQCGRRIERVPEHVFTRQIGEPIDEAVVEPGMNIDALDAAAGLTGVEEGTIDQVLDGMVEIGIGANVGRVLAAEFESRADEAAGGRPLNGVTTRDRAGEGDEIDVVTCDDPLAIHV